MTSIRMTSIRRWFVALMLLAFTSTAGAGTGCPAPGADADVSHQQATDQPGEGERFEKDELRLEKDELEEDEEPDCE